MDQPTDLETVYVVGRRYPDAVFRDRGTAVRFAELCGLREYDVEEHSVRDQLPDYVDVVTLEHDVGQPDPEHASPYEDTRRIWDFEPQWTWATTRLPEVDRQGRTLSVTAQGAGAAWKLFRTEAAKSRTAYWDTPQSKPVSPS